MPYFDSFDPDGGQSSFFAAPPAQPIPSITDQPDSQQLGGGEATYPDIPGAAPAPNQTASGYYPGEPQPLRSGAPFPQDLGQLHEFGGATRDVGAPGRTVAGMPGYDPATDPQIPASARAAPEMSGSVTVGPGGRPVYDPGGGPPDPRIQALTQQVGQGRPINLGQQLGPGGPIDLGRPGQGPTARAGHERAGKQFAKKEQELGPLRREAQEALAQPLPTPPSAPRLPSYEEWRQQHNHALIQGSGPFFVMAAGALMILAAAFGGLGRSSAVPAMQGLGAFANGLGQGNRRMSAQGLADYRAGVQELQRNYENSRQEYEDILRNQNMSIDRKVEALKVASLKYNDIQTYQAAEEKRLDRIDRLNRQRRKEVEQAQVTREKLDILHEKIEWDKEKTETNRIQKEVDSADRDYNKAQSRYGDIANKVSEAVARIPQDPQAIAVLRDQLTAAGEQVKSTRQALDQSRERMRKYTAGGPPPQGIGGGDQSNDIARAREAIQKGVPRGEVDNLLRSKNIDPSVLDQPEAAAEGAPLPASTAPTETYSSGGGF